MASDLYILKKPKSELKKEPKKTKSKKMGKEKKNSHITQLKSLFKKIEFSTWDLLFDQYKNMCIPFEVCKNISSRRRVDLIEKC